MTLIPKSPSDGGAEARVRKASISSIAGGTVLFSHDRRESSFSLPSSPGDHEPPETAADALTK